MENNLSARKVLILAANPHDTVPLNLDREVAEIRNSLKLSANRNQFVIEARGAVRPAELQEYMYDLKPQIVHFSGHGEEGFMTENKSPSPNRSRIIVDANNPNKPTGLVFEDNDGQSKLVSGTVISDLFKIFSEHVECVVLNACYSDQQAKEIVKHIPYVVAMNRAISDEAARNFSLGFYRAIWDGRSIEEAFLSGKNAIELDGMPEGLTPRLFKRRSRQVPTPKQPTPETRHSYWKWLPLSLIIIPVMGVAKLLLNLNPTNSQISSGSEFLPFNPSPTTIQTPKKPEPSIPSLSPTIVPSFNNPQPQTPPSIPKITQIPATPLEKIPPPETKTPNPSPSDKKQKSLPRPSQTFVPPGISVTPEEPKTKATEVPNNQEQETPLVPKKSKQHSPNRFLKPAKTDRKGSDQIPNPRPQTSDTPAASEVKTPKPNLKDAQVYIEQGMKLLFNQKQFIPAQQEFDKAIRQDPNSAWAYNYRGISYCKQGLYTDAQNDLLKSAELFKQNNKMDRYQKQLKKLDNLKNQKCGGAKSE
jgi:CHAT domain/Tetratricopeptide repeat